MYSSGSVPAQKLFFGFSDAGDPARWCRAGSIPRSAASEADSYRRIVQAIGVPAGEILFLSDVVEELDAAREAGLQTRLIDRRDDYPMPRTGQAANGHERVENSSRSNCKKKGADQRSAPTRLRFSCQPWLAYGRCVNQG